jgi:hypothetical protein
VVISLRAPAAASATTINVGAGGDGLDQTATTLNGIGGNVLGAAISASGPLSITNSTISGNAATAGPAERRAGPT